jgi:hypothetical protein
VIDGDDFTSAAVKSFRELVDVDHAEEMVGAGSGGKFVLP